MGLMVEKKRGRKKEGEREGGNRRVLPVGFDVVGLSIVFAIQFSISPAGSAYALINSVTLPPPPTVPTAPRDSSCTYKTRVHCITLVQLQYYIPIFRPTRRRRRRRRNHDNDKCQRENENPLPIDSALG